MSAASASGGASDTDGGIFAGLSSLSTDTPNARPLPHGGSTSFSEDALTVELAFAADAAATEGQSSAEAEPGTVLGSRYLLEEVIGRGGTASVFRAKDLRPERSADATTDLVAVKLSRSTQRNEPLGLTRLQREFHAMRGLSHAGIARVYELDCDRGTWFMSMQLISGQTLKAWMATGRAHAEALKIIDSCCEALEYSHSMGIVHGDLKPSNVLVTEDGTAKLIDFGSSSIPSTRATLGSNPTASATPLFASPQILAGERAEPRDDVFSLACLSYGVLSGGRHPYGGHPSFEAFRAKSAPTYSPAIPVELFAVIARGLSIEPNRRPASVSEFRREVFVAERHRRNKALLSQSVKPNPVQKFSADPEILPLPLAGALPTIVPLAKRLGSSWGFRRSRLKVASLIALMVAIAGVAVVLPHTESALSKRTRADRLADTRSDSPRSAPIPLRASSASLAPIPARAPPLSAKTAPMRHDSSSISFNAAILHASARQSLVAITVRRSPTNENPGEFVWRVERGNAVPSIDYERIRPRRVSFIEGQTLRTLFIPLLNRATSRVPFGPRFFDVVLQPVAGGPSLGRFARITVVIDPASTVWIAQSEPMSSVLR